MKKSKKGFSLIMAIMMAVILMIMASGFLFMVDNSTKSVKRNTTQAKLYWLAESASNYNVRWWVNQPDTVRNKWPCSYKVEGKEVSDKELDSFKASLFKNGAGITEDSIVYRHVSSLFEGNINDELGTNPDLSLEDGRYKLFNVRYKGLRVGTADEAVWILDSYAYDTVTGEIANICLSNVFNRDSENDAFQQAELINETLAASGFHGVKGRFNEQDTRYGPCYFGGLVNLDYQTGSTKNGPIFYGAVRSSSDAVSWNQNESTLMDPKGVYGFGLGFTGAKDEAEAIALAGDTFKAGYDKNVKPLNTDYVVWTWDAVVEYGEESGFYFPEKDIFTDNEITVRLNVVKDVNGDAVTQASLWSGPISGKPDKVLTLGTGSGTYTGVAVPENYDETYIQGVSNADFSLITETAVVNITDDLYLDGMQPSIKYLNENHDVFTLTDRNSWLPEKLWQDMLTYDPSGHLAIVSGLGIEEGDFIKQEAPIYFPNEDAPIYSNAAYVVNWGELTAKGVGNSKLKLFNVGPSMVLGSQEKMSGPSDTAQKWPKVFIQDQRYLRPDEGLPPGCGLSPDAFPFDSMFGLNPSHRWSTANYGKTKDPVSVVLKERY